MMQSVSSLNEIRCRQLTETKHNHDMATNHKRTTWQELQIGNNFEIWNCFNVASEPIVCIKSSDTQYSPVLSEGACVYEYRDEMVPHTLVLITEADTIQLDEVAKLELTNLERFLRGCFYGASIGLIIFAILTLAK